LAYYRHPWNSREWSWAYCRHPCGTARNGAGPTANIHETACKVPETDQSKERERKYSSLLVTRAVQPNPVENWKRHEHLASATRHEEAETSPTCSKKLETQVPNF